MPARKLDYGIEIWSAGRKEDTLWWNAAAGGKDARDKEFNRLKKSRFYTQKTLRKVSRKA